MLEITIPSREVYDHVNNEFRVIKGQTLVLEHSLVSLQKWEAIHHKPFLTEEDKTIQETRSYVQCMTITNNVDPEIYNYLTESNMRDVNAYISDSMTATHINTRQPEGASPKPKEIMTAEVIYYYMIALQIPFECKKWHLNQLLTLINVCSIKNEPPKKMSKSALMKRNSSLNAARRAALHTKG